MILSLRLAVLTRAELYSPAEACNLASSRLIRRYLVVETHSGPTVADLFRRAQAIRNDNPQAGYKDIAKQLIKEFSGGAFPPTYNLTIPEQDARAPEEDWSAGLPLVL